MNTYERLKLCIFESCESGEITTEEKNDLLTKLEESVTTESAYNKYLENVDKKLQGLKEKKEIVEKMLRSKSLDSKKKGRP